MKTDEALMQWLLEGDVSLQYQVFRDLLHTEREDLRQRIQSEGWAAALLTQKGKNGHWGQGFYSPKWTSSHYTLLDLRNLHILPGIPAINDTLHLIFSERKEADGGINPGKTITNSDVCINGMVLNYASYFKMKEDALHSVVDFILTQKMPDGGFNCRSNRSGAVHSSLHTTLSIAEGILEYARQGYTYRLEELIEAEKGCQEFMLLHRLYKSDKTGDMIDKKMTMLSYPSRWKYDILRALDYFRLCSLEHDSRMDDALEIVLGKRRKDGTWPIQAKHPGKTHFDMEKSGKPSRWNTLRALRVLRHFGTTIPQ